MTVWRRAIRAGVGVVVAVLGYVVLAPAQPSLSRPDGEALSTVWRAAAEEFAPYVVRIRPEGDETGRRARSGVIVRRGVIATCAEQVAVFGADDLVVETLRGRVVPARLAGRDLRLRLVLLVAPELDLDPAPRASRRPEPGALVGVAGAVLADAVPTLTTGVVSAVDRFGRRADQFDAALDASNVGGGVIDLEGRLLGIPVFVDARLGERSGVGFFVPWQRLEPVYERLLRGEQLEPGRLGIVIERRARPGNTAGVEVQGVSPRSPAAAAGLEAGDRIVRVEGRETPNADAFRDVAADLYAGQRVQLELLRAGVLRRVELTLVP